MCTTCGTWSDIWGEAGLCFGGEVYRPWMQELVTARACGRSSRSQRSTSIWHARPVKVGRDDEDRTEIRDVSERLIPELATPPVSAPGICPRCSTWTPASDTFGAMDEPLADDRRLAGDSGSALTALLLCENCVEAQAALDREPLALSVISLYRKPSPLRDVLTRYKGRDDEDDPFDPRCVAIARSMLGRYLLEHGDRLLEVAGGIDGIVVVPSTQRPPPHPLEGLVDSLKLELPRWPMLERGAGTLGFRRPNQEGYRVIMRRKPSRVLLLDDVYTTGSRLNSAAAALSQDNHTTVTALVLARRINTGYAPEASKLWSDATAKPYNWQASPRTVAS